MKMENIVPRAGMEPTSLAFQASVQPITPRRLPDITTIPTPTCLCDSLSIISAGAFLSCICMYRDLKSRAQHWGQWWRMSRPVRHLPAQNHTTRWVDPRTSAGFFSLYYYDYCDNTGVSIITNFIYYCLPIISETSWKLIEIPQL